MIISHFKIVRPDYIQKQEALLKWIQHLQSHFGSIDASINLEKIKQGVLAIESRGTIVKDCLTEDLDLMEIFHPDHGQKGAMIDQRLKLYDQAADRVYQTLYESRTLPENLIHVSCTGYIAPSAAQKIVATKKASTIVTHAYHMGCYGAFPALRMAQGFLHSSSCCDIVHTEFCSLHFDPSSSSLEQLVIFSLFGDGSIVYRLSHEGMGLKVLGLHEEVIPNSLDHMTWLPSSHGMKMTISKEVPIKIGKNILSIIKAVCEKYGVDLKELMEKGIFAIHPGGPKIIDFVAQKLELSPSQYEHSKTILRNYGNMSSATIPHILELINHDDNIEDGRLICAMAFGPGLTVAMAILKKISL